MSVRPLNQERTSPHAHHARVEFVDVRIGVARRNGLQIQCRVYHAGELPVLIDLNRLP